MQRALRVLIVSSILVALGWVAPPASSAHQDGCHRWHSCPSDTDSYVCGDLGYTSGCGGADVGSPTTDLFNCVDFATQADAQATLHSDPTDPHNLDADNDGLACEDWRYSTSIPTTSFVTAGARRVGIATTPSEFGYWTVDESGFVRPAGDADYLGSYVGRLSAPIVGITSHPTTEGYWLVAADGGVFSFGAAQFHGSTGAMRLNSPIVAMVPTRTGAGYWLVAADGGVFTFGDAAFLGSMGGTLLNQPVRTAIAAGSVDGYTLVASDGGVFTFGAAPFFGSLGDRPLNKPIAGGATTGGGYWLVATDGGVFAFGAAPFAGSLGDARVASAVRDMAPYSSGNGYWLVSEDGTVYALGDAPAFAR